ncbi:MAG: helix-turn-helix transcriptional regulator [Polyangiaceae bacterium]
MGRRSQTETVAGIYQAFLQRRTWSQANLAKELDVTVGTLRRVLVELQAEGMPLHRDEDHPQVYWSVGKDWYPGSVLFKRDEVPELLRQLRRVPRGAGRRRVLDIVLDRLPGIETSAPSVITHEPTLQEEQYLSVVEDSSARVALWMKYYTASRGDVGERHASVHRVHAGPPTRFIATCHRSGTLKTFRVDGILWARLDPNEPFRPASEAEVDAYDKASLDGFHEGGTPRSFSFVVRNPEARWVKNNLLSGMRAETCAGGERITLETTALGRLARFVVALGAAATPETPALAKAVVDLARGALASSEAPSQERESTQDKRVGEQPRRRA